MTTAAGVHINRHETLAFLLPEVLRLYLTGFNEPHVYKYPSTLLRPWCASPTPIYAFLKSPCYPLLLEMYNNEETLDETSHQPNNVLPATPSIQPVDGFVDASLRRDPDTTSAGMPQVSKKHGDFNYNHDCLSDTSWSTELDSGICATPCRIVPASVLGGMGPIPSSTGSI